ncbi:MAG: glycosyltransferase, partial [Firmicutes bacterium]|nr:glycosyltransferase [Bacillota bacterium]
MSLYSLVLLVLALLSGLVMVWKVPLLPPVRAQEDAELVVSKSPELVVSKSPELAISKSPELAVSIIIPARNEEHRLPPLLKSLAEQDYQPLEILVVDDHSTDHTAEVARQGQATVVPAAEISEGWIGKTRACWSGALAANGDTLVFLDADTRLDHPDSLRRLVQAYARSGASGMLSVQPYHTVVRWYESLSAIFNIILIAGMNRFTVFGQRLTGAGAFGPCIVCRRADYFQVGGHEAVRGAVLDDLAIGQLFQHHGLTVNCFGGRGVLSFRMYAEGFRQLIEGWTKNFGSAVSVVH